MFQLHLMDYSIEIQKKSAEVFQQIFFNIYMYYLQPKDKSPASPNPGTM